MPGCVGQCTYIWDAEAEAWYLGGFNTCESGRGRGDTDHMHRRVSAARDRLPVAVAIGQIARLILS